MPRDGGATKKAAIRITKVGARALPDADPEMGEGSSDPYVVFILYNEKGREQSKARTRTLLNCSRNPTWPDEVLLSLPQGFAPGSGSLGVEVWDEDTKDADDFMGQVKPLKMTAERGIFAGLDVQGHGSLHDFKVRTATYLRFRFRGIPHYYTYHPFLCGPCDCCIGTGRRLPVCTLSLTITAPEYTMQVSFKYEFVLPDADEEGPSEHRPPRPLESYLFDEAFRHTSFMQARRAREDPDSDQQQEARLTPRPHRRTGFMAARQKCNSHLDEYHRRGSPQRLALRPAISEGWHSHQPRLALKPRCPVTPDTSTLGQLLAPITPALQPSAPLTRSDIPPAAEEGSNLGMARAPPSGECTKDLAGSSTPGKAREECGACALGQHRDAASVHLAAAQRRLRALQRNLEVLRMAETTFAERLANGAHPEHAC